MVEEVSAYKIEKDILFENPFSTTLEPDASTVEYYFDLRVDKEIPEKDICKVLSKLDSTNKLIDDLKIKCPDVDLESAVQTILPSGEACEDPDEQC